MNWKIDKRVMEPVRKWHTNDVLKGWEKSTGWEKVNDLAITRLANHQGIVSVWKVKSIWQRFKFLFHGEITFGTTSKTHPPILIYCSDVVAEQEGLKKSITSP